MDGRAKRPATRTSRAERAWMRKATLRSVHTLHVSTPTHSATFLQAKKNLLLQAGFLNLVGERGLRLSSISALRAVAAQRCLAALDSNLLRRFSSSLLQAKKNLLLQAGFLNLVGERGFEPPTPSSRTKCATRLRHSPMRAHVTAPVSKRQPLFHHLTAIAWKAN